MRLPFLAIVAFACCMLQHLVTLSAASQELESLLVRTRPHHHPHHHKQNLTLTFTDETGTVIGHVDTTPRMCFAMSVSDNIHSGWLDYKNTTNQWALSLYSDAECNDGVYGIDGDGVGGIEWAPDFQSALTSAPIITQYTSSWAIGNSPWSTIPFMQGIVDGECETWLIQPTNGTVSWKYVISPSNNTWQYYEWADSHTCSGPPGLTRSAEIGSPYPDLTMVVSITNDYTCAGSQWGSCPPNNYCSAGSGGEWVCATYGGQ